MAASCKHNDSQNGQANVDTLASDSTEVAELLDTTPPPMFLYVIDKDYMMMVYWSDIQEPQRTSDNAEYFAEYHDGWELQEGFRRNAGQYTKLITSKGNTIDLKYNREILKDPDGKSMFPGELHGRKTIPSPGLKYDLANAKDAGKLKSAGGLNIVVTESYLASRTPIKLTHYTNDKKMPANVVKKLEEEYNMKAQRSKLEYSNDRYSYGIVQFKGAYRTVKEYGEKRQTALALEVFTVGDTVYSYPVEGHYDKAEGPTWNVDDEGMYIPSYVMAFEGPKGPEFCYIHYAPESSTAGMYYLRDGKVTRVEYTCYHNLIDEEEPLWNKDIAKMLQLCRKASPQAYKNVKFSKYRYIYLDGNDEPEVWLRDKNDTRGAFFFKIGNNIQLLALEEDPSIPPVFRMANNNTGYLELTRKESASAHRDLYELKDNKVVHHFHFILKQDIEMNTCTLDGNEISVEKGQLYIKSLPQPKEMAIFWRDIEE